MAGDPSLFGASRTRSLLSGGSWLGADTFRAEAEASFFLDPAASPNADADQEAIAGGQTGDYQGTTPSGRTIPRINGYDVADAIEPFTWLEWTWADGTVENFSEIDRDAGSFQLYGRLLTIGTIRRALSPDRTIQRTTCMVELDNADGHFDASLLSLSYLGARLTLYQGYRTQTPAFWRENQIAAPFMVERMAESRPQSISFQLVDASSDLLGKTIFLPKHGTLNGRTEIAKGDAFSLVETMRQMVPINETTEGTWARQTFRNLEAISEAPAYEFVVNAAGNTRWVPPSGYVLTFSDPDLALRRIPMPLGVEYWKAGHAWAHPVNGTTYETNAAQNPAAVIVLGASRRRDWCQPHAWWGADGSTEVTPGDPSTYAVHGLDFALYGVNEAGNGLECLWDPENVRKMAPNANSHLTRLGGEYAIYGRVTVDKVTTYVADDPDDPDWRTPTDWWVAYLVICVDAQRLYTLETTNLRHEAFGIRTFLARIQACAAADKLFIKGSRNSWGHGHAAEGGGAAPYSGSGDALKNAGGIIEYLLKYHAGISDSQIDLDALRALGSASGVNGHPAAGVIYDDAPTGELISGICRSHQVDCFVTRRGKLSFRPAGPTELDIRLGIPRARLYTDEYEIGRDSFVHSGTPLGEERWGAGSAFTIDGVKDHTKLAYPKFRDGVTERASSAALHGREYDRKVDVSWIPQPMIGDGGSRELSARDWVAPYMTPYYTATVEAGLLAGSRDLGDWLRLQHFAGPNAAGAARGWVERLFSIEAIDIDLQSKTYTLDLVDRSDLDTHHLCILDNRDFWTVVQGGDGRSIDKTNGSDEIVCNGFDPATMLVQGDIFWIPHTAGSSHEVGLQIDAIVGNVVFLTTNYTGNTSASWTDFKFISSHETQPDNAQVPGAYPVAEGGATPYLRLCDKTLTDSNGDAGAFSAGGNPGYTL